LWEIIQHHDRVPEKKEAKLEGKKKRKQSAINKSRADQVEGGRVVGQAKTQLRTSVEDLKNCERQYFKQTKKGGLLKSMLFS
jgi:hypothetical protein